MSDLPVPPIPPATPPPATLDLSITAPKPAQNVTSTRLPTDNTTQTGAPLWIRKWSLTIGSESGDQALDLSQLSFEFDVTMGMSQTPWRARVKVWNPPSWLPARVGKEYTNVNLDAGYMQPSKQYGNVVKGQVNYFRYGRQNATDTFLEMWMAMHDSAFTAAVVNTWVPPGSTTQVTIDALVAALAPYGITKGQITAQLSQNKSTRGRSMSGMVRDYMRDIARTEDAKWFIDTEGKLHLLKQDEILALGSTAVPVLNPQTGLIDVPSQALQHGIEIHALLNPSIKPGGRVLVNNPYVTKLQAVAGTEFFKDQFNSMDPITAAISPDGYYTVGQVKHWGQNRGNPWYSFITTKAFDNQTPQLNTASGGT